MKTIRELLEAYKAGKTTPTEVVKSSVKNIDERNAKLNALLEVAADRALARAKELESKKSQLNQLPLYGVPLAIKDNILVEGWQATAGSKILKGYISPYTATCVARLEAAGAIVLGKANCDEFAMGSSNENSAYGPVRNPWDVERVPGGSSGGSAAAVAAHLTYGSLGSDTGGSIRQPASLCGLVGIKPSYGRVSRYGVIAYGSSLDQVGPFGRSVWDAARILEVMSGYDSKDATTTKTPVPAMTQALEKNPKGLLENKVLGVPRAWMSGVATEVLASFENSLEVLKNSGVKIVDIELPHAKYALSSYYLVAPSEASSNLARYDGIHYGHRAAQATTGESMYKQSRGEGFGREVKLRIMLGTYALSAGYYDAYYVKANQVRILIKKDFEKALSSCDCVAVPTSPTTAFRLGEKSEDPLQMYLSDIFTIPVNLAGLPGVSVPCGVDSKGLPIGLQLIGKNFDEVGLLSIAAGAENCFGFSVAPKGFT